MNPARHQHLTARIGVAAVLAALGLALAPPAMGAAADGSFVVTSTGDDGDPQTVSNCALGTGTCTLRAAIIAANSHANVPVGPDTITFDIPGALPHVIAPTTALPQLTDPVTIDAGLASSWAPRRVELTGVACNPTASINCEGLVVAADDTTIRGLAINAFFQAVRADGPDRLVLEGNFVETDATGMTVVHHPTAQDDQGVLIIGSADSRIGGDPARGQGNLFAAHSFFELEAQQSPRVQVLGNYVGVAADGRTPLGSGTGVWIDGSPDAQVGTAAMPNVLTGGTTVTTSPGIIVLDGPGTSVQGNHVGVDVTGLVRTGVGGVDVQSDRVLIGGPGQGNIIAGGRGVNLQPNPATGADAGIVVSHNLIGTDLTGTAAIPNGTGVSVAAADTTIADNLISGNTGDGIGFAATAGPGSRVVRNRIGVGATGAALGNGQYGVLATDPALGGGHVVGGSPADANTIAHNGLGGVAVAHRAEVSSLPPPAGVSIRFNSIFDNGSQGVPGLGIDLPGGATLQAPDGIDDLDADIGANDLQNAPEITGVASGTTSTVVTGRLRSTPGERFDLDLYDNSACDETGYGEAERFLATQPVTTSSGISATPGLATFQFTVSPPIPAGHTVAAAATNANGSTSELSQCGLPLPGAKVTYTGPQTATYSDPVTLSGRLETVTEPSDPIAGRTLELTLGSMAAVTAGPTSSAGTATAAPFAVTLAPGTQTVTTAFTGDETYNAATDSDPIEIVKEDCTLTYTGDTTGTAGSSATLSAQFGETDASPGDWSGHEVDFTVVASAGTSHHTASTNASGVATAPVALPAGTFSIAVAFAGDDLYNPCRTFADTQVVVQLAATQVTYTGPATATYSDPVTLSGRLETAASPASPVPGRQLSFTLGSMPTGTASPTGPTGSVATAPIAVSQPPGDTLVTTAFAGDAAYAAATDSDPVRVLKEDCTLAYTGDTLVSPATATTLRAQFGENDTSPGDWSGHALQFVVVDAAMATTSYPATTTTTGAAAISVPLPANVYAVRVTFAGDALYNGCGTVTDTLFTVEQASAKVTGGGWVSNSIGRTSFGLNLIPQAGGLFTSQFQVRTADKSSFHGSGAATPTVLAPSSVRWTGTGRWNGATGYGYVVTTTDNGSSGSKKADLIAIVIYRLGDPGHPVLDTGSQPLKGGNLTVH